MVLNKGTNKRPIHYISISTILKHQFRASCVTYDAHRSIPLPHLTMGRYRGLALRNHPILTRQEATHSSTLPHSTTSLAEGGRETEQPIKKVRAPFSTHTFVGLLAKIRCNICSYQLNIWYVDHMFTLILNLFFYGYQIWLRAVTTRGHCISGVLSPTRPFNGQHIEKHKIL